MSRGNEIGQLLRDVDASVQAPPALAADELGRLVRRRHARRLTAGRLAVAALLLITVVAPTFVAKRRPIASEASARVELARLDDEARRHARAAELLLEQERTSTSRSRAVAVDPSWWLRRERAEAAQAMVRSADRLFSTNGDRAAAAAAYRRAIELFPDTPAASTASRRLESIPRHAEKNEG
jgi:hypothetical protein